MLAGFWQRKEAFHGVKLGDRVEAGMKHIGIRGDHLNSDQFIRKSNSSVGDGKMKVKE